MKTTIILLVISGAYCATVYVGSPGSAPCPEKEGPCHSLDYYARHTSEEWPSGTKVVFQPGTHHLGQNISVNVTNTANLTLTAKNCSSKTVVNCSQNAGFNFTSVTNLKIDCLALIHCGLYSEDGACHKLRAAIRIQYSANVAVTNVKIMYSLGYGLCVEDMEHLLQINNSLFQYNSLMSGAASLFGGHLQIFYQNSINSSLYIYGTNFEHGHNPKEEGYAPGITLKVSCPNSSVNISIENATFTNNTTSPKGLGGHIAVTMSSLNNYLKLADCKFNSGEAYLGGAIYVSLNVKPSFLQRYNTTELISISNCQFQHNIGDNDGGAVYLIYHRYASPNICGSSQARKFVFNNCTFINNSVKIPDTSNGAAIHFKTVETAAFQSQLVPQLQLFISNGTFVGNSQLTASYTCGQLYFTDMAFTWINTSTITNSNCSGILSDHSMIMFDGLTIISNNSANRGGGLYLGDGSEFYLMPYTNVLFSNNRANYGGGIYVDLISQCFLENVECIYQLDKAIQRNSSLLDTVAVSFQGNVATTTGHDIFGGSVLNCYNLASFGEDIHRKSETVFHKIFHFAAKDPAYISSTPLGVCFCNNYPNCTKTSQWISIYPGQKFNFEVILIGQLHGPVPGKLIIKGNHGVRLWPEGYLQLIPTTNCTNISFNVYSNTSEATLILTADAECKNKQLLDRYLHITFKKCPAGFIRYPNSDYCKCIGKPYFSCYLDNETIVKDIGSTHWVGYDEQVSQVAIGYCPYDYCKQGYVRFHTTPQSFDQNTQCNFERRGILCGQCPENKSAVLGGSMCLECSNESLSLLVFFAVGGLLLVLVITMLDITVSHGAINGLIFYSNVVQVLSAQVFPSSVDHKPVLFQFISWLNLNLGIRTCFNNGMDTYSKTWLQWCFPLYLLLLILLIVFGARQSTFIMRLLGRNSTNVLATLLLLSFSKIILNIVSVFVFTPLYYHPSGLHWKYVWSLDGNIAYGSTQHILLIIVGLCAITFTVPFVLLLLFAQVIRRINNRFCNWISHIKPLIDAYTGIYKDNCVFWTGHLLLVRGVICIVATIGILHYNGMILGIVVGACIHILTLSIWLFRGVYKHWALDILESSFILNICFLAIATALVKKGNTSVDQKWFTYTSISVAFVTFIGILFYHLHLRLCHLGFYLRITRYFWRMFHRRSTEIEPIIN